MPVVTSCVITAEPVKGNASLDFLENPCFIFVFETIMYAVFHVAFLPW